MRTYNARSHYNAREVFLRTFTAVLEPETRAERDEPWRASPLQLLAHLHPNLGIRRPPHLRQIEDAIIAAEAGTGPRKIIINMPPQHGKSMTVSHATPVWFLDRHPEKRVMLASYQERYASTYSMFVRDTIQSAPDVLRVMIREDTRGRTDWWTTAGGGMIAQGIRGSFTGRRGHLIIVDDPIKDAKTANSTVERNAIWEWFESTIETRLAEDGIMIIVMTRWHEDDLVGRVLNRDGDGTWLQLVYPALAEGPDDLGRQAGDALWPEQYSADYLLDVKARRAPHVWSGMYRQQPTQPEGAIVKREWYAGMANRYPWEERGQAVAGRYISIDTAESDRPDAAYSVAHVSEFTHSKHLRLVHVERVRLEPADLEGWVRRLINAWDYDGRLMGVVIEKKSTGVTLISTLRRVLPSRYRRLIYTFSPTDSKDQRLHRAAVWMKNGCYLLPAVHRAEGPVWLADYERELFGAPASLHRDQADATAQIIIYLEAFLEQGYQERNRVVGYQQARR